MQQQVKIENKIIGGHNPCFIIAEAGINHNGNVRLAKKLIDVAVEAGADAVKFQTFNAENVVTLTAEKAEYQKDLLDSEESQYKMLKKFELSEDDFWDISDYAKKSGIIFLSTPFDEDSVDILDKMGVPAFKIPSGEITNFPLLKRIGQKSKPIILSTGMATLGEIEDALNYLNKQGIEEIILLHCTTSYPAPVESVNIRALETLRCAFRMPVGFSDHTEGIIISIAAVSMGACVIEKHFTLDRTLPGPDHKASLEPQELIALVKSVRDVERAFGNGIKTPNEIEKAIKKIARKSIVARRDINSGDILTWENLIIKRPGTGIEPKFFDLVLNKKARIHIQKDQVIQWDMIE